IAHRPATIALADRVVLVDGGRVVAEGAHQSLLATDDRYREVLAAAAAREAALAGVDGNGRGNGAASAAVSDEEVAR
ncbi:MAG: ABC transporter ATP-binding protein, partial [Acidimicrobiales bacterium]